MEAFIVRAIERMLVILVSGGCIYLGYRLFLAIPFEKDAEGSMKFPKGIEITLSRIGPGAFFALFGSVILVVLVYQQVTYSELRSAASASEHGVEATVAHTSQADSATVTTQWSGARAGPSTNLDRDQQLRRLGAYMITLNKLDQLLADPRVMDDAPFLRSEVDQLRRGLMQSHWGPDLGDWAAFRDWVSSAGDESPPPVLAKAVKLYRHGQ